MVERGIKHDRRYFARVTIEFESPFLVGGGEPDLLVDSDFIADCNGLPAIPGSSIAGVVRHEFSATNLRGYRVDDLFGFQEGEQGCGSRLCFSWGSIHDSRNLPVEGRIQRNDIEKDIVLCQALYSQVRDHVRIEHTGTAADKGKFDERCVSAGHRFTVEISLEGNEADHDFWNDLLALLRSGNLRLGGKSRRGYGKFGVVKLRQRIYHLPEDFSDFTSHPYKLQDPMQSEEDVPETTATDVAALAATLHLQPEGFWFVGGGYDAEADMAPVRESRVVWSNDGHGCISEQQIVIPATAIKGPIAHRIAYYHNALVGRTCDDLAREDFLKITGSNNEAVKCLFGYCKEKQSEPEDNETPRISSDPDEAGRRGILIIDDVRVDKFVQKVVNHVAIDRFTGGAMSGALFAEKPMFRGDEITVRIQVNSKKGIDVTMREAFRLALVDLVEGRLGIGSGTGRGNGFFSGSIQWSDDGDWIGGKQ